MIGEKIVYRIDDTDYSVTVVDSFECPFCSKASTLIAFDSGEVGVTHEMPECCEFLDMSAERFVAAAEEADVRCRALN